MRLPLPDEDTAAADDEDGFIDDVADDVANDWTISDEVV